MRSPSDWINNRVRWRCPADCNRHSFGVGPLTFYVSYQTVVGMYGPKDECSRDQISVTTSKHQSELGSPGPRVSEEEFSARTVLAVAEGARELLKELKPLLKQAKATAAAAERVRKKAAADRASAEEKRRIRAEKRAQKELERQKREADNALF